VVSDQRLRIQAYLTEYMIIIRGFHQRDALLVLELSGAADSPSPCA